MNRRHGNKQRNVVEESIVGVVVIVHDFEKSGPGKSASIQIYSGTELDPSEPSFLHFLLNSFQNQTKTSKLLVDQFVKKFEYPSPLFLHHNHSILTSIIPIYESIQHKSCILYFGSSPIHV